MLSLLLKNRGLFTDDHITDEVARPGFAAGVGSTQYGSQTVISHLVRVPAAMNKLREEFRRVSAKHPAANAKGVKDKLEMLKDYLSLDTLHDLEYLSWVVMEGLRWQAPNVQTSWLFMDRDTKIGDINVRKGDAFNIDFDAIHFDAR